VVLVWIVFLSFILVLLALDLGVFHREARVVRTREAVGWCAVWVSVALAFAAFVYFGYDRHWFGLGLRPEDNAADATLQFLTGYVVELSLSVDNVFVMAMLFTYFGVPRQYQHRVLYWGILGALVMRGAMIGIGAALVSEFSWILYIFGIFLLVTAVKMWFMGEAETNPEHNIVVRLIRRFLPVTRQFHGEHFIVRDRVDRRLMLTPLALVLVMVETTDLIFAVDSIPAIFAITTDPFLVFTSNVFAILGLRSLYFALAGALHAFHYLKHALSAVLFTVGVKLLAHDWLEARLGEHFNLYLLLTVIGILAIGVLASVWDQRARENVEGAASDTGPGV
jgi:tellurite resistance protein TerC